MQKNKIHPIKYRKAVISAKPKLFNRVKVVVAMSGGVDSSVAATLLKKQGFDVVGIMMKFWSDKSTLRNLTDKKDINRCCSLESENLARLVAKKIGIPFYVINVEKEFKKKVVDYFLEEYKKGNTPNPCVVCNKEIKFGFLIKKALSLGADFVATGHYARITREIPNPKSQILNKSKIQNLKIKLLKGKDKEKDQSYFLWQLNQKQLGRVLFPVGGYTKPEVRKIAKKFKLPTAETPESQEVCFVSDSTNNFLKKYLKTKPGPIVEILQPANSPANSGNSRLEKGKISLRGKKNFRVVGKHNGLWFYTIGQRKGLEIQQGSAFVTQAERHSGETKPWFVVEKDFKKNILVVSKNEKDLENKELIAKNVNWILPVKLPINAEVKIRYKSGLAKAKIFVNNGNPPSRKASAGEVKIIFAKPQRAITPGQSAVFYNGNELLGGGIIQ